jgi:hypothetical protein
MRRGRRNLIDACNAIEGDNTAGDGDIRGSSVGGWSALAPASIWEWRKDAVGVAG